MGLQSPKEDDYGSYPTKVSHQFQVVTLTKEGKPIARKNVRLRYIKLSGVGGGTPGNDNLSTYSSDQYHRPHKTMILNTDANGKENSPSIFQRVKEEDILFE